MRIKKRLLSLLLCGAMLFSLYPQTAAAEGVRGSGITQTAGLCEHHPQHDESCGYAPATDGTPCTFVCGICGTEDGSVSENTAPSPEGAETATPSDASPTISVEGVQAMIAALPTAEALAAMSLEEQQAVYEQLQAAYDAYEALTDEQKAEVTGAEIMDALFDVFNEMTEPLTDTGAFTIKGQTSGYGYSDGVLTVKDGANFTISMKENAATSTSDRIVVESGATASITLNGVNISAPEGKSAIELPSGSSLTLILSSNTSNSLTGGDAGGTDYGGAPGIHVPQGATLTVLCGAADSTGDHICDSGEDTCGKLAITGGSSSMGFGGVGIGGGIPTGGNPGDYNGQPCGAVMLLGGNITVTGGESSDAAPAKDIGGSDAGGSGSGGAGGTIIILTNVTTGVDDRELEIGGGTGRNPGAAGIGIKPSTDEKDTYEVYGDLELPNPPNSYTIPEGVTLVIPDDTSLTIPQGVTLTNNGQIIVEHDGMLTNNGDLNGNGKAQWATPDAPTFISATPNTITINTVPGQVYYFMLSGNSTKFEEDTVNSNMLTYDSLAPATTHYIYTYKPGNGAIADSDPAGPLTAYTAPQIMTQVFPNGTVGVYYSKTVNVIAGPEMNADLTISDGSLPTGLNLSGYTISGTPTTAGKYVFTIQATKNDVSSTKQLTITILPGSAAFSGLTVKNRDGNTTLTYGDTITVTGTIKASGAANTISLTEPTENQAALFLGDTQLTAPVAVANDGKFTITYDTGNKGITPGNQTLTVKYGGSDNLNAGEGTTTITLNPKPVTASVSGAVTKEYNGDTDVALTLAVAENDLVNETDALTITAAGTFDDKNVGESKTVTVGDLTVGGTDQDWYSVTAGPGTVTGAITAKTLTPSITGNTSKTYDGTTTAPEGLAITLAGIVEGDAVTATATFAYDKPDVGERTITASNITLDGEDSGNYVLSSITATTPGTITKKSGGDHGGYSEYTITARAGTGGSISPSGSVSVREGRSKTFTITPESGYRVYDVRVDGKSVGAVSSYTFDNVRARHTIEAVFAKENPDTGADNPFTDVHPDDWFFDHVMYVYHNGLMNGTSATTFEPNASTTRAQIAVIFYRMDGSPAVEGRNTYTDVEYGPGTEWYYDAVTWAQQKGIMSGYGNNLFGPNDPVTRQQLAVVFYNYARYKGYDVTAVGDLSSFTDAGGISSWAQDAMRWAVGIGLMSGKGDGILDPQGTATRAEIAAMLHRFIEYYKLVPPSALPAGDGGTTGTGSGGGWTQQVNSPQTGDNSNIGLWASLMLLSLSGAILSLVMLRRRQEDEDATAPQLV